MIILIKVSRKVCTFAAMHDGYQEPFRLASPGSDLDPVVGEEASAANGTAEDGHVAAEAGHYHVEANLDNDNSVNGVPLRYLRHAAICLAFLFLLQWVRASFAQHA
jgi:hypothetical protein